jgi:hypothetical protein
MKLISCFIFSDDYAGYESYPLRYFINYNKSCKTGLTRSQDMTIINFNLKIVTRINPRYGRVFLPETNEISAYE